MMVSSGLCDGLPVPPFVYCSDGVGDMGCQKYGLTIEWIGSMMNDGLGH